MGYAVWHRPTVSLIHATDLPQNASPSAKKFHRSDSGAAAGWPGRLGSILIPAQRHLALQENFFALAARHVLRLNVRHLTFYLIGGQTAVLSNVILYF
jgi:hypothetical protein